MKGQIITDDWQQQIETRLDAMDTAFAKVGELANAGTPKELGQAEDTYEGVYMDLLEHVDGHFGGNYGFIQFLQSGAREHAKEQDFSVNRVDYVIARSNWYKKDSNPEALANEIKDAYRDIYKPLLQVIDEEVAGPSADSKLKQEQGSGSKHDFVMP